MTYQASINNNHLQTIYRVMVKRIGKGYSAERLSFLIGKDPYYVEKVETLQIPIYSPTEMDCIALALEETDHRSFYAPYHDDSMLNVYVEKEQFKNHLTHSYSHINENNEDYQLFKLMEELFGDTPNSNENYEIAKDAIALMVRGGYFFEAKMPFEILHSINHYLPIPVNAFYVERAIGLFCEDGEDEGPLKKCESVIDGFRYEER